jgi:hypothetical protein
MNHFETDDGVGVGVCDWPRDGWREYETARARFLAGMAADRLFREIAAGLEREPEIPTHRFAPVS